jgi:hypothetical protein
MIGSNQSLFSKGWAFFFFVPYASRLTVKRVRVDEISVLSCIVISIFCNLMYIITKRLGD